ncbi:MFS transporter [Priestia taiwanensis]|uniref:MFS transporter n=1 Tax=Priestia taiwanensis TaxID=1347902 RepID=A0A917EST1_9BACI|nr:MFS transporter [Priestia taiwanensis]MBM7363587.1 MFS family permease [Priestia taiwanensis]GGE75836.1 MFS transporter [Priestia taiwanensis]
MKYFLYFIVVTAFIDTFSQLPIISPYAQSLGATPLLMGMAVGMYSLSNMMGNVVAGEWIDRTGAKKVLGWGMLVTGIILLSYTVVTSPIQLIIIRFLHGISGGFLVPAAFTFLANRSEDGKQGKAMALSGAAVGFAAIVGPAFSGIVKSMYGIEWVFIVVAVLMIVCSIFVFIVLPGNVKSKEEKKRTFSFTEMRALWSRKGLVHAYIGSFALMFSQGILAYMLPVKVEALGLPSSTTGMLLSTFGIVAIIFFILPTNKIFDRFQREIIMLIGMGIIAFSLVLLSIFDTKNMMFVILGIYGLGFAFIFPSMSVLIVQHTTESERGKAFGIFYAFFSLGVVAGSFITGALSLSPAGGFLAAALNFLIIGSFIAIRMRRREKQMIEEQASNL